MCARMHPCACFRTGIRAREMSASMSLLEGRSCKTRIRIGELFNKARNQPDCSLNIALALRDRVDKTKHSMLRRVYGGRFYLGRENDRPPKCDRLMLRMVGVFKTLARGRSAGERFKKIRMVQQQTAQNTSTLMCGAVDRGDSSYIPQRCPLSVPLPLSLPCF